MKKRILFLGLFVCFALSTQAQTEIKADVWYELSDGVNNRKLGNNGDKTKGAVMVVKNMTLTGGHWKFIPQQNGLYKIQNRDSNMFLATFGMRERGSKIRQTDVTGDGALWRVIQLQGGRILIQNNASLLFLGTISDENKADLVQMGTLGVRITWSINEVNTENKFPININGNAFKPRRGGRVVKAFVSHTNQITVEGLRPRNGERIYFFPQRLAQADPEGLSFDPDNPPICGEVFLIRRVLPNITLNKPMPNMRNKKNQKFMFMVEIF